MSYDELALTVSEKPSSLSIYGSASPSRKIKINRRMSLWQVIDFWLKIKKLPGSGSVQVWPVPWMKLTFAFVSFGFQDFNKLEELAVSVLREQ